MCLENTRLIDSKYELAWKIFALDDGLLRSPFVDTYNEQMHYKPNVKNHYIVTDTFYEGFYSFKYFYDAVAVIEENVSLWCLKTVRPLIVLPVHLYDKIYIGELSHNEYEYEDGMNYVPKGYRDGYISKVILVHDTPEWRESYYNAIK